MESTIQQASRQQASRQGRAAHLPLRRGGGVADRKSPLRLARLHVSATSAFCSAEDPSEEAIWRSISLLPDSVHPLRHSPPPPRLPLRTPPTTVPPALSPPSALAHRRTHVAARHDLLLPVLRHVHQLHNITVVGIVLRLGKLLCCRVGPLPPRPQLSFLSRTPVWSAYCHDGRSCCSPAAWRVWRVRRVQPVYVASARLRRFRAHRP